MEVTELRDLSCLDVEVVITNYRYSPTNEESPYCMKQRFVPLVTCCSGSLLDCVSVFWMNKSAYASLSERKGKEDLKTSSNPLPSNSKLKSISVTTVATSIPRSRGPNLPRVGQASFPEPNGKKASLTGSRCRHLSGSKRRDVPPQ